ncbi:adenylate/guanylate cyclase domain-containing protein [Crassaminicella profunda]|uniref:adenylate/guanylate cyclase domain-containing protein n=1 Tax=Crassaminicella profunda TaxID=1286698 RepID=UPI001CA743A0|nr:adenylate/guanylate cyclase domain-containing protein [Crassaminicella profunda]QZY54464.1 HAMP domain-containing protein [Crassaminicella profunda]
MKKKTLIIICIIIAMVASIKMNDLGDLKPKNMYLDKAGFLYFTQLSEKYIHIVKVDQKGNISYNIKEKKYKDNYFYEYGDMIVDDQGQLYVIRYMLDTKTYLIHKEQIVKYDRNGRIDGIICSMDYTQSNEKTWEKKILSLRYVKDNIYFASVDHKENIINTYRIPLDNNDPVETIEGFEFSDDIYFDEVLPLRDGGIILMSKLGEIYKIEPSGEKIEIYPSNQEEKETIPDRMHLVDDKNLYFTEVSNMSYVSIKQGKIKKIYNKDDLLKKENNIQFNDLRNINLYDENKLVGTFSKNNEKGIIFGELNGEFKTISKLNVLPIQYIKTGIIIFGILIGIYVLINVLMGLFLKKTSGKMPIVLKHIIIVIPIVVICMSILGNRMDVYFTKVIEDEVNLQLYSIAREVAGNIDMNSLKKIKSPRAYRNEDYIKVSEQMDSNLARYDDYIKDSYDRKFYGDVYLVKKDKIYTGISSENWQCYYPIEYLYDESYKKLYDKVLEKKDVCIGEGEDSSGEWIFALAPIKDENENIIGIAEIGMGKEMYRSNLKDIYMKLIGLNSIITLIIVFMFLAIVYYLLKPLKELKIGASEIAVGNFATSVDIQTKDEMGDLGKAFNKMSSNIQNYVKELTQLNEAYYRFVPFQFFELLKKENILEVELGDQVQKEMTIMFSNIRKFYEISNTMDAEENFLFMNKVFKTFGPLIIQNNGIVERYDNAGILSLYQKNSEDALTAAIALQEKLYLRNKIRDKENERILDMGIAIHKGKIMLGIIGQENRMSAKAVSENINLTLLLEKLSIKYGVSILVTESAIKDIDTTKYHYRYIGKLLDQERKKEIKLYDFFDGDLYSMKSKKLQTKKIFEDGIMLYTEQRFYEARKKFIEVMKYNKEDEAAKIYLFLCEKYYKKESLENWNAALQII